MARLRMIASCLVALLVVGAVGCDGGGGGGPTQAEDLPDAFTVDAESAVDLEVTDEGGGIGVSTGEAYAAVYVPPGAVEAGSTWVITPLAEAPAGAEKALCPGVHVDTAGAEPSDWCSIGFSLPGTASPDATIVKLADDGTVAEIVPTARLDYGERTFLTAYVDGFSAYTTSEEDQAARDAAAVEQMEKKGQTPDWTIKAIGTETQENQGWTFNFEFDLFASGGSVGQGGTYKGTAMLSMDGTYDDAGAVPYYTAFADVNGIGRDQALTFTMIDPPLASLLTGAGGDMPCADGVMNLEGMGDFNASAYGIQGEKAEVSEQDVQSTSPVPFLLKVTTFEDVQVEIENVGIFPGKILRTSQ